MVLTPLCPRMDLRGFFSYISAADKQGPVGGRLRDPLERSDGEVRGWQMRPDWSAHAVIKGDGLWGLRCLMVAYSRNSAILYSAMTHEPPLPIPPVAVDHLRDVIWMMVR